MTKEKPAGFSASLAKKREAVPTIAELKIEQTKCKKTPLSRKFLQ